MNMPTSSQKTLQEDIAAVLNRHSVENASNTPDFILAMYLLNCLAAFDEAVQQRETWYGRDSRPTMPGTVLCPESATDQGDG